MKSRTSFFDKTVLKKDLLRFSPLWALYLIGGLLIMHIVSGFYDSYYTSVAYNVARDLNYYIGPMGIFSALYGFLCAQLLFGDLHSPRLCNGLHAMPLRREGWYLTHITSGLLMGLVPPLVIALTLMPYLGQFWFTSLLCWGGLALHYLFFFALAVLCMMCTGNRFAATAVYGLLNFLSLIVYWFAKIIYIPMLPGVRANPTIFNLLCPAVELVGRDEFFFVEHLDTCSCYNAVYENGYIVETWSDSIHHEYGFMGLGGHWDYLWILAGVGIVLLALGLVLYRRRQLERAGDFMAFKSMKPIFLAIYSLCVGGVLFYLGDETSGPAAGYIFFAIGLAIGYFTGKMLLERTIRVFHRRSLAGMGIFYAAVALSLLLTWADPVGISRRIPDSEKVETVYLYDGYLSDYRLNDSKLIGTRSDVIAVTNPEDIAEICEIHGIMIQENKAPSNDSTRQFTIQYRMKNGTKISRTYRIHLYGGAWNGLKKYMTKPEYLFGCSDLETLKEKIHYLHSSELGEIPEDLRASLMDALWLDAKEGRVFCNSSYIDGIDIMYFEFQTSDGFRALYCGSDAKHVAAWIEQYRYTPQLLLQYDTLKELIASTYSIYVHELDWKMTKIHYQEFLTLLWQDCQNGKVASTSKWSEGTHIEVETDPFYLSLTLAPDSQCAQWIQNYQHGVNEK